MKKIFFIIITITNFSNIKADRGIHFDKSHFDYYINTGAILPIHLNKQFSLSNQNSYNFDFRLKNKISEKVTHWFSAHNSPECVNEENSLKKDSLINNSFKLKPFISLGGRARFSSKESIYGKGYVLGCYDFKTGLCIQNATNMIAIGFKSYQNGMLILEHYGYQGNIGNNLGNFIKYVYHTSKKIGVGVEASYFYWNSLDKMKHKFPSVSLSVDKKFIQLPLYVELKLDCFSYYSIRTNPMFLLINVYAIF